MIFVAGAKGEIMSEYIDREKVMLVVKHAWAKGLEPTQYIEQIPAADVVPVVHGRWEYIPQTLNTLSQLRCPFCGWWSLDPSIDGAYNYCPNCGEKMDKEKTNGLDKR